ncbi:MAG TPA: hypothetical protein VGQ18_02585 [Gemmatimonadales bacterium]|jgi:YD repeat-containing protein|nr:hypothetical protein [Gemmatimonadales bacterium]
MHRFVWLAICFVAGAAAPAHAQRQLTPGSYGPVFQEVGFHDKGAYFEGGFQTTVNHYGGNLIVSATDVSIPSQGKFALAFYRTHNSNRTLNLTNTVPTQVDGPLGMGWTGHYGLLWRLAPGQSSDNPEFVDGSGARHVFHAHNHLTTAIPIGSSGARWISPQMEILTRTDTDHYVLRTPSGLIYELTKLSQYEYLVPTLIRDVHGNEWTLAYDATVAPYFEHPLPSSITDQTGRSLRFEYWQPVTNNTKKRLRYIRFGNGGPTLAEYRYTHVQNNSWAFLERHLTGEGRATIYVSDPDPIPEFGTITRITAPTGGDTVIGYQLKTFFYRAADPKVSYAVTSLARDGHTWTYEYPGSSQPNQPEFTVTDRADALETGTYTYYTYATASVCDPNVWRVGTLTHSTETWGGTTRTRALTYEPFQISLTPHITSCNELPKIPRMLSETIGQDGFNLVTTYSDFDSVNRPRRIDAPGSVRRNLTYQHVADAAGYQLGLPASEETLSGTVQVGRTVYHYPSSTSFQPDYIDFYRNGSSSVRVNLDYYGAVNGKRGSLRTKRFGRFSVTYDYSNGVLSLADYDDAPDVTRVINGDGTLQSETRNGVTTSYSYDRDFRPTHINFPAPESDATIEYTATQATFTRGAQEIRITVDTFGRQTERRELVQTGPTVYATSTWSTFDAFDRATTETTTAGAVYTLEFDVHGRLKRRSAANDAHVFTCTTRAAGVETMETRNGTVVYRASVDHLGRPTGGSTNGNGVTLSYSNDTSAPPGIRQTASPSGHSDHWVKHDFLGTVVAQPFRTTSVN